MISVSVMRSNHTEFGHDHCTGYRVQHLTTFAASPAGKAPGSRSPGVSARHAPTAFSRASADGGDLRRISGCLRQEGRRGGLGSVRHKTFSVWSTASPLTAHPGRDYGHVGLRRAQRVKRDVTGT
ncbi:hypothetical protein GCM10010399_22770 [Dactylosporangium fulvum]